MKKMMLYILLAGLHTIGFSQSPHEMYYPFSNDTVLTVPVKFAPGLINGSAPTFSPDGKTIYHHIYNGKHTIMVSYFKDGSWTPSKTADFSGTYDELEPCFTPDGKRLYFYSDRPIEEQPAGSKLVYIERIKGNWSEAKAVGGNINIPGFGAGVPSISKNGNLYFGSLQRNKTWPWEIYYSRNMNGKYSEPVNINDAINPGYLSWSHCIAPDESFIVFCTERPDGIGGIDLYASVKVNDKWTQAKNLGPIVNTKLNDVWPRLSPDGKYLFFRREEDNGSIYQIDIKPLLDNIIQSVEMTSDAPGITINKPELFYESQTDIHALAFGNNGLMYIGGKHDIYTLSPEKKCKHFITLRDTTASTTIWSMIFDKYGNLFIAANDRIIRVDKDGNQEVIIKENFSGPCGVTDLRFDRKGNLYIAYDNLIARYDEKLNKSIFVDGNKYPIPIKWIVGLEFSADEKYLYIGDCWGSNAYVIPLTDENTVNSSRIVKAGFCQYLTRAQSGKVYLTLNDGRKDVSELLMFERDSYTKIFCSVRPLQNENNYKKTIAFGNESFGINIIYCIIGNKIFTYNVNTNN